ncbi:Proteasome subunit beta type-5 [Binucleata daphniae]
MLQNIIQKGFDIQEITLNKKIMDTYIKPKKGTTTLAFLFKHGMIIAVDSRATAGSYIASQTVQKVIEVNKFLLGTMAGGAADCYYWEKVMGIHAKRYELENNKRISAKAASKYLSDCICQHKGRNLSMGTMVCGWDSTGPGIYYVDDNGDRIHGDMFSVGSGSTIAYGILEKEHKYDMEKEEAIKLGKKAIFYAGHRDAFSGGLIRVYFMNQDGWEKIGDYDIKDEFDKYINH